MIQRMLITDVIKNLEERDKLLKKTRELKKKLGPDSPEFMDELNEINNAMPKPIYLLEDCDLMTGGGFKRGRQLVLDEAKRLYSTGFHILWISDELISEESKEEDFLYNFKNELENLLLKIMITLDESQAKKPGSTIKYVEKDDLLKQTIEAIQLDGTKYLAQLIFGESAKKLDSLKTQIQVYMKKGPQKVDLFDHICLGNLFKLKQKKVDSKAKPEKVDKKDEERSNFVLRFMINTAAAFMTTLNKIQKLRLDRNPNDTPDVTRKLEDGKRHGYGFDQLIEASLGAIFADYGFQHHTIENLILRFTTPYYNAEGKVEGSGYARLSDKNKLIYDKHCNVSYHLFASMKDKGFVQEIGRGVLQHHHRGLNDTGYPKRKLVEENVSEKAADGSFISYKQKVYDNQILETTRLAAIIIFFVEHLNHTPFHIPFQRDNLVRHLIINSMFPPGADNQPDYEGVFDIQTQYPQNKRFDGYLVNCFLTSINLYKIGEKVPVYNFNNTKKAQYDAEVIRYNPMPHRPVIKITDESGGQELDLSQKDNEHLYIGEYIPSLRFQDVIDKYHLDRVEGGIVLDDQELDDDSFMSGDSEQSVMLDDIWDDSQAVEAPEDGGDDVNIDDLLGDLPPELSLSQEKAPSEPEPMAEGPEEDLKESFSMDGSVDDLLDQVKVTEEPAEKESTDFDGFMAEMAEAGLSEPAEETPAEPEIESVQADESSSGDMIGEDELLNAFPDSSFDDAMPEEPVLEEAKDKSEEELLTEPMDLGGFEEETADEVSSQEPFELEEPVNLEVEELSEPVASMASEEAFLSTSPEEPAQIAVEPLQAELYSIYLKKDSHLSPYGLGKLVSSSNTEKKFKITHLSRCVEEHSDAFLYRYSSVNNTDQQIISVYDPETQRNLPFGALKFVVSGGLDKDNLENRVQKAITVGAYHLLYYQKNNKSGGRGEPKYIVRIDKTSGQLDRPIVTFLRYIRVNGNKVDYVRDKNCGKQFDLKEYNFFRLDRELSAKEIVSFLELVLV